MFYLLETKCFKSILDNLLHICNEGLTCSVHIALLICIIQNKLNVNTTANKAVLGIITASWAFNVFFSVLKILGLIVEKIRKFRSSKTVLPTRKSEEEGKKTDISIIDLEFNKGYEKEK